MILGQTRTPLDRPAAASGSFQPKLPHTGFYSHFHPLTMVTHAMRSQPGMYRPPLPGPQGPQVLPNVPAPVATAAPTAPTVPTPGGTAGFGGMGFGSTGGTKMHHAHVDPYMVMRSGMIPGVSPSGSNIRAGIHNAGARVQRSMPFQTAALPPDMPPPAPMPMPMPAATHGFYGAFGAPRRRRHWLSRLITPETVNEVAERDASNPGGCETYPPRADGIKVTVCNGRVVKYEDANGNVNTPDPNSGVEYGSGGMAGFGHHGHHHRHHHMQAEQAAMAGFGFPGFRRIEHFARRAAFPFPIPGGGGGPAPQPGFQPYHHRHHHHPWQQPQYVPPPAPVPAFGNW
jgi:hypothetical protein